MFEVYGFNLVAADLDNEQTAQLAATLAAELPSSSRIARLEHPENAWNEETYMLRSIEYTLRCLLWSIGGKGEKPKPIATPADRAAKAAAVKKAKSKEASIAEALGL